MVRPAVKIAPQGRAVQQRVRTNDATQSVTAEMSRLSVRSNTQPLKTPASYAYLTEVLTVPEQMKPAQKRILKKADALFDPKLKPYDSDMFLEKYVPIRLTEIHHACFLNNIEWDQQSTVNARTILYEELKIKNGKPLSEKSLQKLDAILRTIKTAYTLNGYGGHFKAEVITTKDITLKRLPYTQISCTQGRIFELIKYADADKAKTLSDLMGKKIVKGNCTVAKGGISNVRYAYEPASKSHFAAKQVTCLKIADAEIHLHKQLPDNGFFVKMIDYTHIYRDGKYVKSEIIYPLMTKGDAFSYIRKNCQKLNLKEKKDQFFIKKLVFNLITPVAHLHANHFCHRDIKPENYLVGSNNVMLLSDFGLSAPTNLGPCKLNGYGTPGYLPWNLFDKNYTGIYHDNVSLALTLLQAATGTAIVDKSNYTLPINGLKIPLQFTALPSNPNFIMCQGINRAYYNIPLDKYDTLYEIAAGFLDTNPTTQLQPFNAIAQPYFQDIRPS